MTDHTFRNKNHWYDGTFYDKIVAPNQTKLFNQIKHLITDHSAVLDVGCGTGYLSFMLSDKCKSLTGIDLSKRNIQKANKNLSKKNLNSIHFVHSSLESLEFNERYDFATITYVLHEIDEENRLPLLQKMFTLADKVIIGDYLTPQPQSFSGIITEIIEFIAGKDHFKNFKNFQQQGGLKKLIQEGNFEIISEIINQTNTIVVLKQKLL